MTNHKLPCVQFLIQLVSCHLNEVGSQFFPEHELSISKSFHDDHDDDTGMKEKSADFAQLMLKKSDQARRKGRERRKGRRMNLRNEGRKEGRKE